MDVLGSSGIVARLGRLAMSSVNRIYAYACRVIAKVQQSCPVLLLPLRVCRAIFPIFIIILYNSVFLSLILTVFVVRKALSRVRRPVLELQVGLTSFGKKYRYQNLEKKCSEIRLLKVRPAAFARGLPGMRPIRAELITSPIATAPPFAAVSYRWTYSETMPVLIGNRILRVSSSICELLGVLDTEDGRASEPDRYLWIDSICINQEDVVEKSWQVPMMEEIYRSATHVVGWLGTEAPQISDWRGIDGVGDFADAVGNDFFFRTWIIQEVSLAKRLIMYTPHGS